MTRSWGDEPSELASDWAWTVLFLTIGMLLLINAPDTNAGWFIILGGVSAFAGLVFMFRAIFR